MLCLLQLPIWALYEILKQKGTWIERIVKAFQPNSKWGPKDKETSELKIFSC
jgi:hypothetical protein